MTGAETPEPGDAAELAFEALRAEVAALRRGVELIHRQGQQAAPAAVDYSPTLGQMEKALQAIAGRLDGMERQPTLSLTPAGFRGEIEAVAQSAVMVVSRPFIEAVRDTRQAAQDLLALAGRVRERREQQWWLACAGGIGVMLGIVLWYLLPDVLPWRAGDWLAASLIGGSRWEAGEALMERASPDSFGKMARLYKACGEQPVELCEAAIAVRGAAAEPRGRAGAVPLAPKAVRRGP